MNIGVLVSGGGTNLQAIIDAIAKGIITGGQIVTVVSSREGVFALERAENASIFNTVISPKMPDFDDLLIAHMQNKKVDLIVLAGFMSIISDKVIKTFPNKIINVHPSLIPSFCGEGYYGLRVHKAVLEYGVKVTGATVHYVNEVIDGGKIIMQKAVDVLEGDTPATLQKRVMEQAEHIVLPKAIDMIIKESAV